MPPETWNSFLLEDLRPVAAFGEQDAVDDEHVNWFVTYSKDPEPEAKGHVVIATLHAALAGGRVDATVGGLLIPNGVAATLEDIAPLVAGSSALETLYDYARTLARGLMGTLDIDGSLPVKSPDAEIRTFDSEVGDQQVETAGEKERTPADA